MSGAILKRPLQTSRLQTIHFASIVVQGNNYSNQPQIIKNPTTASLKRGTGGRSSFNGIVCTVFGATGFVGRTLLNRLGKIGTQLIIPYRSDFYFVKDLRLVGDLGQVLFHRFELRDRESIYKCIKYSNVVVNLLSKDWETSNFSYHDVHVEGARRLARLAKEVGVKKFIHVSDLNASPNPKPVVMKNGSDYLRAKWEGECAVKEEFPEAIIIRPATIYGMEDRFINYHCMLWNTTAWRPVLWKKGQQTEKQPVHVGDVAAGIVNLILDDYSTGKTYQFVGPKRYKLGDLVGFIQKKLTRQWALRRKRILDLESNLYFQLRVHCNELMGIKKRIGYLHWEQIERDSTSDVVLKNLPKLEDLGLNLRLFEEQAVWDLQAWGREHADMKTREEAVVSYDIKHVPIQ